MRAAGSHAKKDDKRELSIWQPEVRIVLVDVEVAVEVF